MYLQKKIHELIYSSDFLKEHPIDFVTPDQLHNFYDNLKAHLLSNCKPGDRVAIHLEHGPLYLLSILACFETGFTYVPLKHGWPEARIDQIKELAEPKVFIDSNLLKSLPLGPVKLPSPPAHKEDSIAYIIFTSGSTGAPKGVMIRRNSFEAFVKWLEAHFTGFSENDRILIVADFTFDMSLLDVGLVIAHKAKPFFSKFEGNVFKLASELMKYKITSLATVPNTAMMLLQDAVLSRADYSSLRFLLLGGSRFSIGTYTALFDKYHDRFAPDVKILNFYGPTEATVYTHVNELTGDKEKDLHEVTVSIGKTFGENRCALMNDRGELFDSAFTNGELLLNGIQVLEGYFKDPATTQSALIKIGNETYYRTGDISYRNQRNEYFIQGRMNETIKRRGFRVSLLDIDSYIQKVDLVADCATIAIPDDLVDNKLISFVIPKTGLDQKELRNSLGSILVDYQIPDQILFIEKFPLNSSGKVCRKSLTELFLKT